MANIVLSLFATFNGKALTKGKKQVSAFDKQVKQLGRTFAATFGATALLQFSKKAIKAFAEDEAAAKSLELQLRNTGFAFSSPAIEQYIGNLQKLSGVLDDELRPAFQQLLTVTGSITKSQDALQTALNVSAATGKSLSEVSAALTRGFSGNTAGLSRLGAGISKATLKTGDMDKIMEELNAKFAGQAAARLTTYAGKMSLLQVASADATEIIGEGLIDALTALGDDNSVENLSTQMTNLAESTADVVAGVGALAAKFKVLGNVPFVNQLIFGPVATRSLGLLGALGSATRPARELPANEQRSAGRISSQQFRVETRQAKELARLKALEIAALKKKTAVDELKDKFDLERIGLTAALNAATDEETKLRLKSQLAILDNNEALAKKYLAEMNAAEAAKKMAEAMAASAAALEAAFRATIARLAIYDPVRNIAPGQTGGMSNVPSTPFIGTPFGQAGGNTGPITATPVNVTLELAPNAGEFGQLIYNSFLINQKNGLAQTVNGGL